MPKTASVQTPPAGPGPAAPESAGPTELPGARPHLREAADCATLKLPAVERPLCPTASQKALGPDGLEHDPSSPLNTYVAPPGASRSGLLSAFTRAVITQQP